MLLKNNIVQASDEPYVAQVGARFASDSVANLSEDSSAPGTMPMTQQTVQFVAPAANPPDLHLAPNDSAAAGRGVNLGADNKLSFASGEVRPASGPWTIGADG